MSPIVNLFPVHVPVAILVQMTCAIYNVYVCIISAERSVSGAREVWHKRRIEEKWRSKLLVMLKG
jgi:hypothetical protein